MSEVTNNMTEPQPKDPKPEAPVEPPQEACCTSGCFPCILDLYTEELQQYRIDLAAWQARQESNTDRPQDDVCKD